MKLRKVKVDKKGDVRIVNQDHYIQSITRSTIGEDEDVKDIMDQEMVWRMVRKMVWLSSVSKFHVVYGNVVRTRHTVRSCTS